MLSKLTVTCDAGHQFEIEDVTYGPEVIACIGWCPLEVSKPDLGGIILACGARVTLVRSPRVRQKRGLDKPPEAR